MKFSRLALAIALAPTAALAATETPRFDDQLKLPAVVVTASRSLEAASDSSAAITVFTRGDIERLQASTVVDLLNRVPGVQIAQSGGRGSQTDLHIRGTKSAQSIVLIDGQRIVDAASGSAPLMALSLEQIERIEVLRGPRSAVYGADAIGGVIQIFTRRAEGPGLQPRLRLGYGNRGTWERSAGLSGGDEKTRFNLSASADETQGIDRSRVGSQPDSDDDAYRNNAVSLNLSHRFSGDLEGGISVLDQRGEAEFDQGYPGFYPYNDFQLTSYSGYLNARISKRWSSRLELGHSENRSVQRFDDIAEADPFNTYRDSAAWLNTLTLAEGHSLLLGTDWYEERLHTSSAYKRNQRWNHAGLLQYRFQGERLSTELGLRHDKNSLFGSENTFNGAATFLLDDANDLVLSYAEGFRAPTFTDLYYPDYCSPYGCSPSSNPNLVLEQSKTYELQWRSQLAEQTRLEAALYRTDLENAIVLDSNYIPQNLSTARINGFEASLQQELFGWHGALGLSLVDPRDRNSGKRLARRAKRTLSLDLDRRFDTVAFGASWQTVSRSYDAPEHQREIAGYGLLHLRASWQASPEVELALKLDNALDKDYARALYDHDFDGRYQPYREEGRTALVSVTWTPL